MGKQPVMADVIETPFNIAFQYPFGRYFLAHPQKNGLNGVMRAAHWSETIAVMVSSGLGYGFQSQQPQCLHGPVPHCGYAQRSRFAV